MKSRIFKFVDDNHLVFYLIVFLLSVLEIRMITQMLSKNFELYASAAEGVLHGAPHWRSSQNRLLGPVLVNLFSLTSGLTFLKSYVLITWSLLIFANFLSFAIFKRLTNDLNIAIRYTFCFAVFFILIQDDQWPFIWDFVDLIIFLLFSYGIFKNVKLRWMVVLFFLTLTNKENALFIGLWICIDSLAIKNISPNLSPSAPKIKMENYSKFFLGFFLMVAGMIYTKLIRDLLFVKSMLDFVGQDLSHKFLGQHFQFIRNWQRLEWAFLKFDYNELIIPLTLLVILFYFTFRFVTKLNEFSIKLMSFFLILTITIYCFGNVTETRIFAIFISFILIFKLYFENKIINPNSGHSKELDYENQYHR
jgi:hypothetical protein